MNRTAPLSATLTGLALALALAAAPAHAVVTDDFESYSVGDAADVANPAVYAELGSETIGAIANGVATANVADSQVLEHLNVRTFTNANSADLTGEVSVTFDFLVGSGSHNVWLRDATNGQEGVLIRAIEAGAGAPGQYFLQVQGSTGSSPPIYEDLVNYGEWIHAIIDLHIDAGDPSQSAFDIDFFNLTANAALTPHAGAGSGLMFHNPALINQMRIETPAAGGQLQIDNIVVPEPASAALLALGAGALLVRRR